MKKEKKISKKELKQALELNNKILKLFPDSDSMHSTYNHLSNFISERIRTFEQFKDNPYKMHTSAAKFNSDEELGLGEYIQALRHDL